MADVQANITLTTTGGSDSAAEIQKASSAMQNLTTASGGLQAKFQERFQHIGLMLFAGDALRASGLGAETRMVINSLNLALTEGAAAAGVSSGGIMLVVVALAALAGILVKVLSHHKDESEALAKLADQQQKSYEAYSGEAAVLERVQAAGGNMTTAMLDLLSADKRVADDMQSGLLATQEKEIAALEKQRAALETQQAVHNAWAAAVRLAKEALGEMLPVLQGMFPALAMAAAAAKAVAGGFASLASSILPHVQLTGELKTKYDELSAAIAKVKMQHQDMTGGVVTDLKTLADAEEKHKATVIQATEDEMNKRRQAAQQEADHERSIMDYHVNQFVASKQKEVKENQKALEQEQKQAEVIFNRIGGDVGKAFAGMIVEGKSFTQQMQAAFKQLEEQIIEYIMQIVIKQQLLYMWQTMTGTQGSGSSILGTTGGGSMFGGAFATGGSAMVDRPTMFMAGEAGPELATFTPVGSGQNAGVGGGGGVSVGNVNVTVSGVNDPKKIADQVGDQIIQRIRGMGDLNFTR